MTLLTLPVARTLAFQSVFSFTCCSVWSACFTGILLLHKFVTATTSFFCSSRRFPVPLVQNFPSLVLFFPPLSLSHCPSVPNTPRPPPPQCHRVHMAPACDMKPCQNTPDALFNPPLFQPLLNFKQNKRERGRWWRGLKGKRVVLGSTWCQGNVQQHHNLIHSLVPAHHQGRAALLFLLHFLNV